MRYDVFISYSSRDQKIAEGVCAYLEQYGIRCFVAYRDIPRGVVWAGAIVDALEHSQMMLVLFSKHFNDSQQVDREIELAAEQGMPILTFRLSGDDFTGAKKYYLKNLNWIDAFPNPEHYFGSLMDNVCRLLGKEPTPIFVEKVVDREQQQPEQPQMEVHSPSKLHTSSIRNRKWGFAIIIGLIAIVTAIAIGLQWNNTRRVEEERKALVAQMRNDSIARAEQIRKDSMVLAHEAELYEQRERHIKDSISAAAERRREEELRYQDSLSRVFLARREQQIKDSLSAVAAEAARLEEKKARTAPTLLYVNTVPSGVTVYVDGKRIGTTPIDGKGIARGSHKVKLSKNGYEEKTIIRTFGDKPVVLSEVLKEKPQSSAQLQTQSQVQTQSQIQQPSSSSVPATTGKINGHEWVDLGLSVKWATCNVGASSPSEYGGYYAWGETEEKTEYSWETYKWFKWFLISLPIPVMKKYTVPGHRGVIDNKTMLEIEDDVAHVKWGGSWRIPTKDEIIELCDKCSFEWTTINGVNGKKVIGPNGNSIFIPAAGSRIDKGFSNVSKSCLYWSATLCPSAATFADNAHNLFLYKDLVERSSSKRYGGFSVRPVTE